MELTQALKRIMATGKIQYGTNSTIENIKNGKAKAVVIAKNTPKDIKEDIQNYAKNANIPVITSNETSLNLGEICGKPFLITALAVINPGDVKIKELTEETQ